MKEIMQAILGDIPSRISYGFPDRIPGENSAEKRIKTFWNNPWTNLWIKLKAQTAHMSQSVTKCFVTCVLLGRKKESGEDFLKKLKVSWKNPVKILRRKSWRNYKWNSWKTLKRKNWSNFARNFWRNLERKLDTFLKQSLKLFLKHCM